MTKVPLDGGIAANDREGQRQLGAWKEYTRKKQQLLLACDGSPVSIRGMLDGERELMGERKGLKDEYEEVQDIAADVRGLWAKPMSFSSRDVPSFSNIDEVTVDMDGTGLVDWGFENWNESDIAAWVYLRRFVLGDRDSARRRLEYWMQGSPAYAVRILAMLAHIDKQDEQRICLSYTGQTFRHPCIRFKEDKSGERSMFSDFAERMAAYDRANGESSGWDIFAVKSAGQRSNHSWHALERALVASTTPFNLNVARGGFHHLPHLPPVAYPTMTSSPTAPAPAMLRNLDRHYIDSMRMKALRPQHQTPQSRDRMIDAAKALKCIGANVVGVHVSSDVTAESVIQTSIDVSYFGNSCGPGPKLTYDLVASAKGRTDQEAADLHEAGNAQTVFGAFVDLYDTEARHTWLWMEALDLSRYLSTVQPLFLRLESAQVASLFFGGRLECYWSTQRMGELGTRFFDKYASPDDTPELSRLFTPDLDVSWDALGQSRPEPGAVGVVKYGARPGDYSLAVHIPHGGAIKYDPRVEKAKVRLHYACVSIAVYVEARVEAGMATGVPSVQDRREWLVAVRSRCLKEMKDLLKELGEATKDLKAKSEWFMARDKETASRRKLEGDESEGEAKAGSKSDTRASELQRIVLAATNARHIIATGPPNSEDRRRQYDSASAESKSFAERGLEKLAFQACPRRVDDTDEEHRSWWLGLREGLDTFLSATGYNSIAWLRKADANTRQEYYNQHLRAYTESKRNLIKPFSSPRTPLDCINVLISHDSFCAYTTTDKANLLIYCMHCSKGEIAGVQSKHFCAGTDAAMAADDKVVLQEASNTMLDEESAAVSGNEEETAEGPNVEGVAENGRPKKRRRKRESRTRTSDSKYGVNSTLLLSAAEVLGCLPDLGIAVPTHQEIAALDAIQFNPKPVLDMLRSSGKFTYLIPNNIPDLPRVWIKKGECVEFRQHLALVALVRSFDDKIYVRPDDLSSAIRKPNWRTVAKTAKCVATLLTTDKNANRPIHILACPDCDAWSFDRVTRQHKCTVKGTQERLWMSTMQKITRIDQFPKEILSELLNVSFNPERVQHSHVPASIFDWHSTAPSETISGQVMNGWLTPIVDGRGAAARGRKKASAGSSGRGGASTGSRASRQSNLLDFFKGA